MTALNVEAENKENAMQRAEAMVVPDQHRSALSQAPVTTHTLFSANSQAKPNRLRMSHECDRMVRTISSSWMGSVGGELVSAQLSQP